jgi:Putative DNA-binding domain
MSSLRAIQAAMRAALHDGNAGPLAALVTERSAPRIEVYRSMYWARQLEALADDFPGVRRMLGEELFERVAFTHVRRRPSCHPSLAFLGRGLAETLASLGQDAEAWVAKLEWARVEAFWSPPCEPATPALLGALGEWFAEAVLLFHPSLRHLELPQFAREAASRAAATVRSTEAPLAGEGLPRETVVVWRRGTTVEERSVVGLEAGAVARAIAGGTVADVCEAFLGEDVESNERDAGDPERLAIDAIVGWVTAGWVAGVRTPRGGEWISPSVW